MARRGALTALQAALAGIGGAASGAVQLKEQERLRQERARERERQSLMDTLSLFEKGAFEPGPIATRAPQGPRPPQAAAGAAVPAPAGMGAIPLTGVSPDAMQQAEAGRERYETGGPGAMTFEIGGRRLTLPSAATRRAEAARDALSEAVQQAEATGAVRSRQAREADQENQRMAFNELRALGQENGEFDPNRMYIARLEDFLLRRRAREAKSSTTAGDLSQLVVQRASALRDDFRAEPAVKKAEAIADATRLVRAAAGNPTAAGDLSLIFAYMRILDPTSTVRQGEFANAQSAAGVPDQIRNLYNRVLQGTRLNERQRRDFVGRADDIAKQQSKSIQAQISRFGRISGRYGVPSDLVVYDPFEGLFEQAEPAPAIGGTGGPRDVIGGMPEMSTVTPRGRLNPFGN